MRDRQLPGRLGGDDARLDARPNCSARSSSQARRSPTGPASAASIRCATAAACSAEAGSPPSQATSGTGSSTARGSCRISSTSTRPTRSGRSPTTCSRRSTPKRPHYLEFERWWGGHVNLTAEGNAVHRGRAVRRQQAGRRPGQVVRRDRDRPAQHPLADRGVLFEGRQHHAAAAGARLDTRPLRRCRRDPLLRPDDRLLRPRKRRPSRHLRLRRRGAQGARRVREQYRSHRRVAARPLRSGVRGKIRRHRQSRTRARRMGDALRGANARRHPRAWRQ